MQFMSEIGFYEVQVWKLEKDFRCSPKNYFWKSGHPDSNVFSSTRVVKCYQKTARIEITILKFHQVMKNISLKLM